MKPQEFETDSYQSLQPKLGLIRIKFLTADVFNVFILQCVSVRQLLKFQNDPTLFYGWLRKHDHQLQIPDNAL